MAFPIKFRHLVELREEDVPRPAGVLLEYTVCATETHSCGWQGWTLAGAYRSDRPRDLHRAESLPADTAQRCPRCGRRLLRTDGGVWMTEGVEQPEPPDFEYEVVEPEFVEDPDKVEAREWAGVEFERVRWTDEEAHEHCQACGERISASPWDCSEPYWAPDHHWLCPECYERIRGGLAR